jgi:PilZ domain
MKASDRFPVTGASCFLDGRPLPLANLSVGGLFAVTEVPPIVGQSVVVDLVLPRRPPFRVAGMVAWVNGGKAAQLPHGFGIRITHIDFLDKLSLLDFLKRSRPSEGAVASLP